MITNDYTSQNFRNYSVSSSSSSSSLLLGREIKNGLPKTESSKFSLFSAIMEDGARSNKELKDLKLEQPWHMHHLEALKMLGNTKMVVNEDLPCWLQGIINGMNTIDIKIENLVWSELCNAAIAIFKRLQNHDSRGGNLRNFIEYMPEKIMMLQTLLPLTFNSRLENKSTFQPVIRQYVANFLIQLETYKVAIGKPKNPSFIKIDLRRQNVEKDLEKIILIFQGIHEMIAPMENGAQEPISVFSILTSHIVYREEQVKSLEESLACLEESAIRLINLFDWYKDLLSRLSNKCMPMDEVHQFSRMVSEMKKSPTISYTSIQDCVKMSHSCFIPARGFITNALNDITSARLGSLNWPFPEMHFDNELIGFQTLPKVSLHDILVTLHKNILYSMRMELEKIRFFSYSLEYAALLKENYQLNKDNLQQFIDALGEFFEKINPLVTESKFFKGDEFITGSGKIGFTLLLSILEKDYLCIKEINTDSPGAWLRLIVLAQNLSNYAEECLPKFLKGSLNGLKQVASSLENQHLTVSENEISKLLQAINSVSEFLDLFTVYGEKISTLYNLTFALQILEKKELFPLSNQKPNKKMKGTSLKQAKSKEKKVAVIKKEVFEKKEPVIGKKTAEKKEAVKHNSLAEDQQPPESLAVKSAEQQPIHSEKKLLDEKGKKLSNEEIKTEARNISNIANKFVSFIEHKEEQKNRNRNVTYRELVRELQDAGWRLVRGTDGSHAQFKHEHVQNSGRLPLPFHGNSSTVSIGIVKEIRNRIKEVNAMQHGAI